MRRLTDLEMNGKRVLVRVDFNVPLGRGGEITDDTRIQAALPTLHYILQQGGKPVIMSHLGRPGGVVQPELSLAPVAERLQELLGVPVKLKSRLEPEEFEGCLLLENLRFHLEEQKPTDEFVERLARMGDLYVNDAFGTAHRAHASTVELAKKFVGKSAVGFLMEREIDFLGRLVAEPKRPFVALIGGAKVSTKVGVLKSLVEKVDLLLIGGGMAYTFLKAEGVEIGESLLEPELLETAREILASGKVQLPIDLRVVEDLESLPEVVGREVPAGKMGVDIGPETAGAWSEIIRNAGTLLWNGPVGIFENPMYAAGTQAMARAMAETGALTVLGGGDSVAAAQQAGVAGKIDHISTGGGASLEFLEFGTLPGLDAISEE